MEFPPGYTILQQVQKDEGLPQFQPHPYMHVNLQKTLPFVWGVVTPRGAQLIEEQCTPFFNFSFFKLFFNWCFERAKLRFWRQYRKAVSPRLVIWRIQDEESGREIAAFFNKLDSLSQHTQWMDCVQASPQEGKRSKESPYRTPKKSSARCTKLHPGPPFK